VLALRTDKIIENTSGFCCDISAKLDFDERPRTREISVQIVGEYK
jgi:hypothetical protein